MAKFRSCLKSQSSFKRDKYSMEYIDVEHPISPLLRGGRGSVHIAMSDYRQIKFGLQIMRHPFETAPNFSGKYS